jgi:hypothetical protein
MTHEHPLEMVIENGVNFGSSANLPQDRNALRNIATNADGVVISEGSYVTVPQLK